MLRGSWFPKNHKDSLERFFMKEIFSFKINIIELLITFAEEEF